MVRIRTNDGVSLIDSSVLNCFTKLIDIIIQQTTCIVARSKEQMVGSVQDLTCFSFPLE